MTQIINNRIAHPHRADLLIEPAERLGTLLYLGVKKIEEEATSKGLDVDWTTFEMRTDVDYHEIRTLSGEGDEEFEIRAHSMRVRAHEKGATP